MIPVGKMPKRGTETLLVATSIRIVMTADHIKVGVDPIHPLITLELDTEASLSKCCAPFIFDTSPHEDFLVAQSVKILPPMQETWV